MPSSTFILIQSAIRAKQQITCMFQGRYREMCPHVIGYKNGREQVLNFQFAGESSTELPPGGEWRCMPVQGLSNVAVREGVWHTATNHSRPQTCVDEVVTEVHL